MKKEFILKRGDREIFRTYMHLVKPFLRGLQPREVEVFSEILYQAYLKKEITNMTDRISLILSTKGRAEMAKNLNMTQAILRNAIGSIRKKELLGKDDEIKDLYLLDLDEGKIELSFVFLRKM